MRMNLSKIQQAYSQAIYGADTLTLESLINGDSKFSTRKRVDVYRNNTIGTLKQTLSDTFPVCEMLVGEKYFKQLTSAHVQEYPSMQRNLDLYGESFAETLQALIQSRDELKKLAYLADVAQLEWLLNQSYFATDRETFDINAFSLLSAEQQTQSYFCLAEDIHLMESPFAVYDIWMSHQNVKETEVDEASDQLSHTHNYLLVQRAAWQPQAILIDKALFQLLISIKKQTPLECLTHLLENSPMDIAALIQQGFVTGFGLVKA